MPSSWPPRRAATSTAWTPRITVNELKTKPSPIWAMTTPKQPIAVPATSASSRPAPPAVLVRDARHEHDGDDGQADPDEHQRRRQPLEQEAGRDRDDRGEDRRDRRDDAHPADRQSAIQRRDADPAEDARDSTQQEVRSLGDRLASDDGDDQGEGHADQLREQDDAEHRSAPAGQPATEVAGAPGDRRGQAEQDGRCPAGQGVDQAAPSTDGAVARAGSSTPPSTAVGPGSSTTASAAPSYRSDVVR